ncbi:hypothetical protein [Tateyamaria sp.]|uniref:hypothetical protein n=1 Tax=Tateyamaria sp. TaxID=1929288 RepID=UPI00329A81F2
MPMKIGARVNPRSLAALKRINESGKLPARHFGTGTHKRCNATRTDGQPCRGWAAYRTTRCIKHGARGLAGVPSPNREVRAARNWLMENKPSLELVRTPEWQATDKLGSKNGILRKAALVAAWRLAQDGNWAAWRDLQVSPLPEKVRQQSFDKG